MSRGVVCYRSQRKHVLLPFPSALSLITTMNAFLFLKSVLTRASARAPGAMPGHWAESGWSRLDRLLSMETDEHRWRRLGCRHVRQSDGKGSRLHSHGCLGAPIGGTRRTLLEANRNGFGQCRRRRLATGNTPESIAWSAPPKDPDIAYMAFAGKPYGVADGQIYRSTDRGDTWAPTHFLANKVRMEPNSEGRQEGERVAVDPLDSNVVYYASYADGLWITPDAGVTWKHIKDVPAGITPHGVNTVVFDSAGGDSEGKTKVIYVTVEEAGVFRTMDAGATWTKISDSGPGNSGHPRDAVIGTDGAYYVAFTNEKARAARSGNATSTESGRTSRPRSRMEEVSPIGTWPLTPPTPNASSRFAPVARPLSRPTQVRLGPRTAFISIARTSSGSVNRKTIG